MEKPYLPVLFDEIKDIKAEDFLSWPSQRIRYIDLNIKRKQLDYKKEILFGYIFNFSVNYIYLKDSGENLGKCIAKTRIKEKTNTSKRGQDLLERCSKRRRSVSTDCS